MPAKFPDETPDPGNPCFKSLLRYEMDARVKPAHDGPSKLIDHSLMTIHLNTQADLEDAIRALVAAGPAAQTHP